MREIILHEEATVANRAYFNYDSGLTKDNILGVLNKTTGKAVYTPLKFTSMTMFQSLPLEDGTRNYSLQFTNLPPIAVGDKLLIKIYVDTVESDAATDIKDFFHIVKEGDTVKVITEDGGEEVVVPVELATEQEVKDINDDVMGALYGYGKVTVTMHSLMRTGAETTQDLASVIYVDPEKTWAENGFPTLYDDEGTAIDTTTNPAAGDEVFNYQIQSES